MDGPKLANEKRIRSVLVSGAQGPTGPLRRFHRGEMMSKELRLISRKRKAISRNSWAFWSKFAA
jgi:hypothetical protein